MQYKIPLQIENEDTIVANLSLRQLIIIMVWGGLGYAIFKTLETKIGGTGALVFATPVVALGIGIALLKISEMTFLPTILNLLRLSLNSKSRIWSMGTDSYSELEIGYITQVTQTKESKSNSTLESKMDEEANVKIGKL